LAEPGGKTAGTAVKGTGDDERGEDVVGDTERRFSGSRFSFGTRGADAGVLPPYCVVLGLTCHKLESASLKSDAADRCLSSRAINVSLEE
jgi:hypothetical protein